MNQFASQSGTASEKGFVAYGFGVFSFSVTKCTRFLGTRAEPRHVYAALRRLEVSGELELRLDPTQGRAIHLKINPGGFQKFGHDGSLCDEFIPQLSASIYQRFKKQDINRVQKVEKMYNIMHQVATTNKDTKFKGKSGRLHLFQTLIKDYFHENGNETNDNSTPSLAASAVPEFSLQESTLNQALSSDISLLCSDPGLLKCYPYPNAILFGDTQYVDYTTHVLSRIFHGIDSPRVLAKDWFSHPMWGRYRMYHYSSIESAVSIILSER